MESIQYLEKRSKNYFGFIFNESTELYRQALGLF